MPKWKTEITLEQLLTDYDWAQVFADENAGNVEKTVRRSHPGSKASEAEFSRSDVNRVVAAVNGENDGAAWLGVFQLKDGRYVVCSGSCDYTGWDCQAGNCLIACSSMAEVEEFGLDERERERLLCQP